MLTRLALIALLTAVATPTSWAEETIEDLLSEGRLAEAKAAIRESQRDSDDALLSAQLGVVQMLEAIETLGQTNYRYGVGKGRRWLPFFRLGVPLNENPEVVTYDKVRDLLQRFIDDLARAEKSLAAVGETPIKWKVDLAKLRVDLDGDGQASEAESLGQIYLQLARPRWWRQQKEKAEQPLTFPVGIDTGDIYWLRGYCHVASAIGEIALAYDQQKPFDHTAQLVFPKAKVKHDFLAIRPDDEKSRWQWNDLLDGIAMIHLADWPLRDPERLKAAHSHMLKMVRISRESWRAILAEEDDDFEWIPGPDQKSVLPRGVLNQEQIDAWHDFLDEAEALLTGEKLAPFWRDQSRGVNIQRVFYEPTRFDYILWVQGSAAAPYLEEGDQTKMTTWQTLQRVFRGNFLGFAFWIN